MAYKSFMASGALYKIDKEITNIRITVYATNNAKPVSEWQILKYVQRLGTASFQSSRYSRKSNKYYNEL